MNPSKSFRFTKSKRARPIFILLSVYLGALSLLVLFETYLLFPAPPVDYGMWNAQSFGASEHFIESEGNTKVHAWTFFAKGDVKTTLIFCHGNGESLGLLGDEMATIRDEWKVNVVAFDFRGYGKTGGTPNEPNILADAIAVGRWVRNNEAFREHKIIAMGRSLGGAPAIEIAIDQKTDGLILDRTFSSIVDVAASRYFFFPVRLLMRNQFKSIDKIGKYSGSLLQMHGDVDEVVPYKFGKRLFDASVSSGKKFLPVRGLRHNSSWPEEFWIEGKRMVEMLGEK